jgi:Transaldolase/Fructose-6-phosphate aldolase/Domain of unknown function (DUF2382)
MSSELPPSGEPHIPLHAEDLTVSKLKAAGDMVQIRTVTRKHETFVDETLDHERVQIERRPAGRQVGSHSAGSAGRRYDNTSGGGRAFVSGLERRKAAGGSLAGIESVASFFISRVDTEVDRQLAQIAVQAGDKDLTAELDRLRGQAALANARLAYEIYEQVLVSDRWKALAAAGARPQRLLWASTGVKDKAFSDTRYVTDLVAPDTVNTMPEATLLAVADHGEIRGDAVHGSFTEAHATFETLSRVGVSIEEVATS